MQELSKRIPIWIFISRDGDADHRHRLFAVAAECYAKQMGCSSINLAMEHKPGEKPYFIKEKDIHFSISHSGEYWLCAFSTQTVGLDIQQEIPIENISTIAERFYHRKEYDAVCREGKEIFFQIWTAKESYVKYTGQGLSEDFNRFSCVSQGQISEKIRGISIRHLPFAKGYSLCVCAQELEQIQMQYLFL